MKNFILGLILGSFISIAYAGIISSPPPLPDEPPAEQAYLQEIYDNINKLEIVTVAPNGSKKGKKGQVILYNNSGTFTLWVNTTGLLVWQLL
jgi:hypothetical protein